MWATPDGSVWIFGGNGTQRAALDDLWRLSPRPGDPATYDWTWIAGGPGSGSSARPLARQGAAGWSDDQGNLWLFGGDPESHAEFCNDVWKFDPGATTWTQIGPGDCGSGLDLNGLLPSGRYAGTPFITPDGNFWIFGGYGKFLTQTGAVILSALSDVWRRSAADGSWMRSTGTQLVSAPAKGLPGVAAPDATPGGTSYACGWADGVGGLWNFGGGQSPWAGRRTDYGDSAPMREEVPAGSYLPSAPKTPILAREPWEFRIP